jgi:hypothetical protein
MISMWEVLAVLRCSMPSAIAVLAFSCRPRDALLALLAA